MKCKSVAIIPCVWLLLVTGYTLTLLFIKWLKLIDMIVVAMSQENVRKHGMHERITNHIFNLQVLTRAACKQGHY